MQSGRVGATVVDCSYPILVMIFWLAKVKSQDFEDQWHRYEGHSVGFGLPDPVEGVDAMDVLVRLKLAPQEKSMGCVTLMDRSTHCGRRVCMARKWNGNLDVDVYATWGRNKKLVYKETNVKSAVQVTFSVFWDTPAISLDQKHMFVSPRSCVFGYNRTHYDYVVDLALDFTSKEGLLMYAYVTRARQLVESYDIHDTDLLRRVAALNNDRGFVMKYRWTVLGALLISFVLSMVAAGFALSIFLCVCLDLKRSRTRAKRTAEFNEKAEELDELASGEFNLLGDNPNALLQQVLTKVRVDQRTLHDWLKSAQNGQLVANTLGPTPVFGTEAEQKNNSNRNKSGSNRRSLSPSTAKNRKSK